MEIGQYLRARRLTALVALLLPLLATLAAYLVLTSRTPDHTATATVSVPASTTSSASRIGIFVADFDEVASSNDVVEQVAASTGESVGDIKDGVEVIRLGQSSRFEVTYTGEGADRVEEVVRAVIAETYTRLVGIGAEDAADALAVAQEEYAAAVAARRAYENEIGTLQPQRDYADLSNRIRSLQTYPEPGSAGVIAKLTAQRDALVPQVRRFEELAEAESSAAKLRETAQRAVTSARAEEEEARGARVIRELSVTDSTGSGGLVQGVGAAALAGLLAGLALLVLPDVLRRRGTPGPRLAQATSLAGARDGARDVG